MAKSEGEADRVNTVREARIGEVLNDFLDRRAAGQVVSEDELFAIHPELASELQAHLALLREIRPPRIVISELIASGMLSESPGGRFPARLGPYDVIAPIGRGGMGIVLKGYDGQLNRHVAIKILRPELSTDQLALMRFEQEARAAAALQHPNIIAVHAVGEELGTHFIVMEYVDGQTLAKLIRESGPIPPPLIGAVLRQVLTGLASAHGAGLVHRDIKPTNILLAEDGSLVKIADFGLARVVWSETRMTSTGSVFGTAEYMSPEQARGDAQVDHRADLYSAGVVLYEMLTSQAPFKAATGSAVIHQILYNEPAPPRTVHPSADGHLSSLAVRLMAREPADRFQSAAEALAALESTGRIALPAVRRRRARRIAWCAAGLIAVAGTLTAVWRGGRNSAAPVAAPYSTPLSDVSVEVRDNQKSHTLVARYGDSMEWKEFYSFPPSVRSVLDAALVDVDGDGDRVVVAAVPVPWDGHCLFGFNLDATIRWRLDMSDSKKWPDSGALNAWQGRVFVATDADGRPGEEIIAVAGDSAFYGTRVSLVDANTGAIGATFWHPGQLNGLKVVADFFGEGHPAIFAWGVNNKLDGMGNEPARPYVPASGEDPPVTEYNIVPVAMILDPRSLDGSSPPKAPQLPHSDSGGGPAAYAFVDLPATSHATYVDHTSGVRHDPDDGMITEIDGVMLVRCPRDAGGPCLQVSITRTNNPSGALVVVNRTLRALSANRAGPEEVGIDDDWWFERWHPMTRMYVINRDRSVNGD